VALLLSAGARTIARGSLLSLILPAILIGSAVVALIALLQRKITPLAVLALFQLVSGVISGPTYSASGMPGDLAFAEMD